MYCPRIRETRLRSQQYAGENRYGEESHDNRGGAGGTGGRDDPRKGGLGRGGL